MEARRICLIYQIACFHKDGDFEEPIQIYQKASNQKLLVQKNQGAFPNAFYCLEAYDTH